MEKKSSLNVTHRTLRPPGNAFIVNKHISGLSQVSRRVIARSLQRREKCLIETWR
jgi:hypothetical protein